jgi:hypothetical protein
LEDFGHIGCAWRETDAESADRKTLPPIRIVAFNTTEGLVP